jgi:hypothetical protein
MLDNSILPPLLAAVVAVVGWFAAHRFSVHRDRHNKRREMIVAYLLEAYRRLESAANREVMTGEQKTAFESAVADIQLLGSHAEISTTTKYLQAHAINGGALIDEVLNLLRKDLRRELGLEPVDTKPIIFRFDRKERGSQKIGGD